jgi:TetR/AcrR family transcriptional regulator, regulator of cefoperazone and chloramphenicol sensitivity
MAEQDSETRSRLLLIAAQLFAARGFRRVTVREICRDARANVAAVNYHFGGKLGLYREVLSTAIQTMRSTTDAAKAAGKGRSPEFKLRAYVHVFLERVVKTAGDNWIHQLMMREMADPTPALDLVAERVIRPRLEYVAGLVAEILHREVDDEVVKRCVLSVQAQVHAAMPSYMAKRLLPDLHNSAALDQLAEHIAQFSLAGIHMAAEPRSGEAAALDSLARVRKRT